MGRENDGGKALGRGSGARWGGFWIAAPDRGPGQALRRYDGLGGLGLGVNCGGKLFAGMTGVEVGFRAMLCGWRMAATCRELGGLLRVWAFGGRSKAEEVW